MERIVIQVPNDIVQQQKRKRRKVPEYLRLGMRQDERIQYALEVYQKRQASIGRAARIAGLTVMEMMEEAARRGVKPNWNDTLLREEVGT
jgi:predicted HTH domain antitoxin